MGYTGTHTTGNSQKGFTLLEVLIALLVLAIGLLGLAALQTTGLRSNTMATTRTHSTQLAYDISDRMRANVAGSYTTTPLKVVTAILNQYALASCPHTQLTTQADKDLNAWCTAVAGMLPSGNAAITRTLLPGLDVADPLDDVVTYDVTVYWDEARTGAFKKDCKLDANGNVDYPSGKDSLRCILLNVTIPRPIPNA
jgi:type IV pilus assembly protein PilV